MKQAEEEVWEKNKELWHEFKAEREEQLRQVRVCLRLRHQPSAPTHSHPPAYHMCHT